MSLKGVITLSIVTTIIAVVLIAAITDNGITTPKDKTSHFTVTYKIVYNKITLAKAAELEKKIRSEHEDACSVDIDLKPVSDAAPIIFGRETMPNWYIQAQDCDTTFYCDPSTIKLNVDSLTVN